MIPELPSVNFSQQNVAFLLKISKLVLGSFPDLPQVAEKFKDDSECREACGMDKADVKELCSNLYNLWKYFIYYQPKEAEFRRNLEEVHIIEDFRNKFVELWLSDGQKTVERAAKFSATEVPRVQSVNASTQLSLFSSSGQNRNPEIVLHLDTDQGSRKIILSREQAHNLYNDLNKIQSSLDKLVE